jgi:tetratricopeptide (TPR) repeat protein
VERAVEALGKAMDSPRKSPVVTATDVEALVALHAEIGLAMGMDPGDPTRRMHLVVVRRLMRFRSVADDATFCRRLHLLVGFVDQRHSDLAAARVSIDAAVRCSPDDALSLTALGRIDETEAAQAMPGLTALGGGGGEKDLEAGGSAQLASAARLYRRAIVADPSLPEAHLRLGRILQLQGRRPEAVRELVEVAERSSDRDHVYLANLLLGALHEAGEETSQALACYEAAVAADPEGPTAKLALGHALHRLGRTAEALGFVSGFMNSERQAGGALDAWLRYKMGAFDLEDQIARLLRELRDSVRR